MHMAQLLLYRCLCQLCLTLHVYSESGSHIVEYLRACNPLSPVVDFAGDSPTCAFEEKKMFTLNIHGNLCF